MEVIHIELPDEGGETIVAVVSRKDNFFQFFLIDDPDTFELSVPIDYLRVFFALYKLANTLKMLQSLLIKEAVLSSFDGMYNI
jgi:hypothetical protein